MSSTITNRRRAHSNSQYSSKSRPPTSPVSFSKRGYNERNTDEAGKSVGIGERPHNTHRSQGSFSTSQPMARTPTRSFYHRSFHGSLDQAQYASDGLRDQTAELAAFALSENASFPQNSSPGPSVSSDDGYPEVIEEVSEPVTPSGSDHSGDPSVSALTKLIQTTAADEEETVDIENASITSTCVPQPSDSKKSSKIMNEHTPLFRDRKSSLNYGVLDDIESQRRRPNQSAKKWKTFSQSSRSCAYTLTHPKAWSIKPLSRNILIRPVSLLPAVFLGLLLNVLDALSYGMILFPLGNRVFENLGSDGIAIFYVSTIIAQVVFSSGGSIFRGGIGSEMIEVVPFFHQMAFTILNRVGEENAKSVLATTVLSFAASAILTGVVFFLMGACRLGSLIGFFPRHILIGCIGGVGWFLVATGLEVSARLPGNLEYNLVTLRQLFHSDTISLWLIPLSLAIILIIVQQHVKSNFLVGGYFISVAAIFYFFKFAMEIHMETLHSRGWVFDSPPAENPWYHFYTLYDFGAVNWEAFADTIPAMFALTFFGVLHVPINVPALGISTGEDNLNIDRELVAHGISNCVSGLFGSVQNYLVYTNSLLFMESGGTDRLAGLMLAAATFGILVSGPVIIGFIPIMVVGALIFLLGIELLEEALVRTWGKVHKLEYATIVIIVITMGIYDFVFGILVGIVLAALNFVVQTSRRTAIRATYTGQIAKSTVRRPPVQLKFLREAGQQIFIIKLAGFLFFGTIVGVENRVRALLVDEAFANQPLRFLVLDMTHIHGVDFSAAEAFTRINRLLQKRDVQLIVSGLSIEGEVGQALRNVGLFEDDLGVQFFAELNDALEFCENRLLTALYKHQEHRRSRRAPSNLDVPKVSGHNAGPSYPTDAIFSSPRGHHLHQVAQSTLDEETSSVHQWQAFKQPLPLLLQMFADLSDENEDFWYRAVPFFERVTYRSGSTIFRFGDRPNGFYLLEEGIFRADYDLPQGKYTELIVAGRPCGELPFFSETARTATMTAEKDSIAWQMNGEKWRELQVKNPDVAQELLKISLKLTKERMDVITSYVLTTAG